MPDTIQHKHKAIYPSYATPQPDDVDGANWLEEHVLNAPEIGAVLVGDPSKSDGAAWVLTADQAGKVLVSGGAGVLPAWESVNFGLSNPMTTPGDLIVGGAAGVANRLGIGSEKQVLVSASGLPVWTTLDSAVMTWPLYAPPGTTTAPSYSFAGHPTVGMSLFAADPNTGLMFLTQSSSMFFMWSTDTELQFGGYLAGNLNFGLRAVGSEFGIATASPRIRLNPQTATPGNTFWGSMGSTAVPNGPGLELYDSVQGNLAPKLVAGANAALYMPVMPTPPANPPTGYVALYPKADKKYYQRDDTGFETLLAGSGGGGTLTWPLFAPPGSIAAPSYSFTGTPATGMTRFAVAPNTGLAFTMESGSFFFMWATATEMQLTGYMSGALNFGMRAITTELGLATAAATIRLNPQGVASGGFSALVGPTGVVSALGLELVDTALPALAPKLIAGAKAGAYLPVMATAPATPPSGYVVLYPKSDKHYYQKDDAGVETDLTASGSGGMSNPMTTLGDMILAGAAGTPTRLGQGPDLGAVLCIPFVGGAGPTWSMEPTVKTMRFRSGAAFIQGSDGGTPGLHFMDDSANLLRWSNNALWFVVTSGNVAPPTPGGDAVSLYGLPGVNGRLYSLGSDGVQRPLTPMTTAGDIIIGGASGAPTRLGVGSNTQVLTLAGGVPTWATPASGGMTNPMTTPQDLIIGGASGTPTRLGKGADGTYLTLLAGALVWLAPPGFANPMTASGDVIYGGASGVATRLAKGSDTQVLTLAAGLPTWATPASGGMTNPMTAVGDLIRGGTSGAATRLAVGSNGQWLTLAAGIPAWASLPVDPGFANPMTTLGDVITGGASGAPTRLGIGTTNQVLTVIGGVPTWAGTGGMANPMTAIGDLIRGGTSGVPTRLAVGTNTHVLTLVAGVPTWQAPAAASVTYPLLAPDGTPAAPSYSFASLATFGIYFDSSVGISFSASSSAKAQISTTTLALTNSTSLAFSGTTYAAADIILRRDAGNILAQKNGTNLQRFRVYSDATLFTEVGGLQILAQDGATATPAYSFVSNPAQGMWLAGTNLIFQSPYSIVFMQSTATVWGFNPAALTPGTDNAQDIGSSGNRIKNLYVGTSIISTGDITVNKASPELVLNRSAVSGAGSLRVKVAGLDRWVMSLGDSTAESGANAGSNFALYRYTDAGAFIDAPLSIDRQSGKIYVPVGAGFGIPAGTNTVQIFSGAGTTGLAVNSSTGNTSKIVFMISSQVTGGLFQVDDIGAGAPIRGILNGLWRAFELGAVDSAGAGWRQMRVAN